MTPDQWIAQARERQDLPSTITDPTALARLAVLLRPRHGQHNSKGEL